MCSFQLYQGHLWNWASLSKAQQGTYLISCLCLYAVVIVERLKLLFLKIWCLSHLGWRLLSDVHCLEGFPNACSLTHSVLQVLKGIWLCLCYQEQQLSSQAQSVRITKPAIFLRDVSFYTLSAGIPAFLSKPLPILPSPIPERLPDVWQCLNSFPLSKHGPAALPDALLLVSALDDEGSPGREEQPAGFWREGLLVLQGAEGRRRPLPAARF